MYICNSVKTQGFDHEIINLLSVSRGSVVRLSYEYSNMTLKSPTYCDRTSYVVIFFRKSNSKSISNPNSKIYFEKPTQNLSSAIGILLRMLI